MGGDLCSLFSECVLRSSTLCKRNDVTGTGKSPQIEELFVLISDCAGLRIWVTHTPLYSIVLIHAFKYSLFSVLKGLYDAPLRLLPVKSACLLYAIFVCVCMHGNFLLMEIRCIRPGLGRMGKCVVRSFSLLDSKLDNDKKGPFLSCMLAVSKDSGNPMQVLEMEIIINI